jgi:hypothetical protein
MADTLWQSGKIATTTDGAVRWMRIQWILAAAGMRLTGCAAQHPRALPLSLIVSQLG